MTKTIAIILAAVLVIGGGVTVGVVVSNNNLPQNVAKDAILSLSNIVERMEFAPIYQTFTGGSIQMTQTFITQDGKTSQMTNSAKIFFADDGIVVQNINLSQDDVAIQGDLWLMKDFVYVSEQNILGGSYAWESGKLAEQFEESIFAYGSNSKYALDNQAKYEEALKLLTHLDKVNPSAMEKDLKKVASNYIKKIWEIACEEIEFEEAVKVVKIDGQSVEARNIKITVDADDICDIWEDTLDFLREDDQVVKFLDKYEDVLNIANNPVFGTTTQNNKTLADTYTQLIDDWHDNYYNTSLRIQNEWGNNKLIVDISTPKHQSKLLKLNVSYGYEDMLTLDFAGKTIENASKITLVDPDDVKHVYQVVNGDQILRINYTVDGEKVFSFNLDRESSEYTWFTMGDDGSTTTINGTLVQAKNNDLTITVKEVTHDNERYAVDNYTYTMDLTFVLKAKDKLPQKPTDYKTLATIPEKDVDEIVGAFGGIAE